MKLTTIAVATTALLLVACAPREPDPPQYDNASEQIADPSGTTAADTASLPPPASRAPLIQRDSGIEHVYIITYRETGCKYMWIVGESASVTKLGCPAVAPTIPSPAPATVVAEPPLVP